MMHTTSIPLVMALERRPQSPSPTRDVLSPEKAAALVQKIADDLVRLFPGIDRLDLAAATILFDPAQLLRPGWPADTMLTELVARAPGSTAEDGGRLLAFGGDADNYPASALTPDQRSVRARFCCSRCGSAAMPMTWPRFRRHWKPGCSTTAWPVPRRRCWCRKLSGSSWNTPAI